MKLLKFLGFRMIVSIKHIWTLSIKHLLINPDIKESFRFDHYVCVSVCGIVVLRLFYLKVDFLPLDLKYFLSLNRFSLSYQLLAEGIIDIIFRTLN